MNIRGVDGCDQPFANNFPLSDTPRVRTHDLSSDTTIFPIFVPWINGRFFSSTQDSNKLILGSLSLPCMLNTYLIFIEMNMKKKKVSLKICYGIKASLFLTLFSGSTTLS